MILSPYYQFFKASFAFLFKDWLLEVLDDTFKAINPEPNQTSKKECFMIAVTYFCKTLHLRC